MEKRIANISVTLLQFIIVYVSALGMGALGSPSVHAAAIGDETACTTLSSIAVGDVIDADLDQATDCFIATPGRLVDRRALDLDSDTVLNLTLESSDFRPMVWLSERGDTPETLLGRLRGLRLNPVGDSITAQTLVPAGHYIVYASSVAVDAEDPATGGYTLSISELDEAQLTCSLPSFIFSEGPVAQASISTADCELGDRDDLEVSETPRYYDQYALGVPQNEVVNLSVETDFDYRLEHWVTANNVSTPLGASPIVAAGQSRVFGLTTEETGSHIIYVVAVNPGETGDYFFAVDDYFEDQRDALFSLYNATGGVNWTDNSGWLGDAGTECSWYGITCENDMVRGIDLSANNLVGRIPSDLRLITDLLSLDLSGNSLTGSIPVQLSHLDLETLLLQNNQLTGTIPVVVNEIESLVTLDLSGNNLGSVAPGDSQACTDLPQINVGDAVSGSLNDVYDCFLATLGRLVDRRALDLDSDTVLNLTLESSDFRPMVWLAQRGDTPETLIGPLRGLRLNPVGNAITMQTVVPAGNYVVITSSVAVNADNPAIGDYVLTLAEAQEAQTGCTLPTFMFSEGPGVQSSIATDDCVLGSREDLEDSETPRYYDQYALGVPQNEVVNLSVETDFDYRLEHWVSANNVSTPLGASPIVAAGQSRVFGLTTEEAGSHIISVVAVNPDETGDYFFAVDDYFEDQRDALFSLYNATGGANWTDNSGWLGDAGTECAWYGITCENDMVRGIDLSDNNLVGTIPSDLRLITDLLSLDLSGNSLTGSIPVQLSHLDLESLLLQNNQLTGTVPAAIHQLDTLNNLNVDNNNLTQNLVDIEFKYTFDGVPSGTAGHVLQGLVKGILLDDNDSFEVVSLLQATLAGFDYDIAQNAGLRAGRENVPPVLSLSGDYLDFWVCPAGFESDEIQDCAFGAQGGFLISEKWAAFNQIGAVHAGIPDLGDAFRDSDRPINRNNWVARVRTEQRATLISLYEATGGDDWTANTGWLDVAISECDWSGVSCTDGAVTGLDLRNNNLIGDVPEALYALDSLSSVSLSGNTLTGIKLGSPEACTDLALVEVGDALNGDLSNVEDCFLATPGRLVDRRALDLENDTILRLTMTSSDFRPMVWLAERGDTPETLIGPLRGLRLNPNGDAITLESVVAAGNYIVFTSSVAFNADNPIMGDYTLTIAEAEQAQLVCSLPSYVFSEGPGVQASITTDDCVLGDREDLEDSATPRYYDQFALGVPQNEVVNISVETDFDYRLEHWLTVNLVSTLQGSSPIVAAGQSRVFGLTTEEVGSHVINIVAVNPGETGDYFFAVDDYFEDQRDALFSLYNATGGANWTDNSGWLGDEGTECSWYGITCENGMVRGIDLSANNLVGTIPSDLRLLVDLLDLDLSDNQLSGTIPVQLSHLDLETLLLQNNQLSGTIPAVVNEIESLVTLDLSGNNLGPVALGDSQACTDLAQIEVGGAVSGSLNDTYDCFIANPGRLVDRRALDLENDTVLRLTLESSDYRPMLWLAERGDTPETLVGPLRGLRFNPSGNLITLESMVPAGNYVVVTTSLLGNAETPPIGDYTLTVAEAAEAQIGCTLPTFMFSEGPGVQSSIATDDCVLGSREDLEDSETPRYYDQYALGVPQNEVVNLSVSTDFDYRLEHWVTANNVSTPVGASPIVGAGQSRVFGLTTEETGSHIIYVVAVNPGETGDYFFAVDDYFEDQRDALFSLYNATGGANWTDNSGWLGDEGTECSWYGITCENDRVRGIDLSDNNLVGTIPSDLQLITDLLTLDLSDNSLVGFIPVELAYLDLENLLLQNNQLSGTIPAAVDSIESLLAFETSGNDLGDVVLGNQQACTQADVLALGDSFKGVLSQINDCFEATQGRLLDRYAFSLSASTVVDLSLGSTELQPLVGIRQVGSTPDTFVGALIGARGLPFTGTAHGQYVLPAGDYLISASTLNANQEAPSEGRYLLELASITESQVGCSAPTFVRFGSVVAATLSDSDCASELEADEGKRVDVYSIGMVADDDLVLQFTAGFGAEIVISFDGEELTSSDAIAAGTPHLLSTTVSQAGQYVVTVKPDVVGANGSYALAFLEAAPVIDEPPASGGGTPTPPINNPVSTINDLEEELDDIISGNVTSEETSTRIGAALDNTELLSQQVANGLPEGSAGVDLALSALTTMSKTLEVSTSIRQQGGQVTDAALVKSLGNVASVFTSMAPRSSQLTTEQKQNVQTLTDNTVTSSEGMLRSGASNEELIAVVAATSAVINAAAAAGAEITPALATKTEQLVTKAIKTGIASFSAGINVEDPAQVENLLRTNPEALEFAVSASVAVTSRLKADSGTISTELSNRGVSASVSASLTTVLDNVSNPDGVSVGGVNATEALLSALTQFLTGGSANPVLQAGINLQALNSNGVQIDVDPVTGGLIISAPGERYHGAAVSIRMVSNSMPQGISYMRDGRALVVGGGLAIEIAPTPSDLIAFTAAVQEAGYNLSLRNNGAFEIALGNGDLFSGAVAYDNLDGITGECGALEIVSPQGSLNDPHYAFELRCGNGAVQRVTPIVHNNAFYTAVAASGSAPSTDRNTGVVTLTGIGHFKPGYFVSPLTVQEQTYLLANGTKDGVAIETVDVNDDGIMDYVFLSAKGAQPLYGVVP